MNPSPRSKHIRSSNFRRHSLSQLLSVHFKTDDDPDNPSLNNLNLTVRQPSFSSLLSDPTTHSQIITKDGEILSDQSLVYFEPKFDRRIGQFPYVNLMKSLCNKSIYSDLSISNSANEDNEKGSPSELLLNLPIPDFSSDDQLFNSFNDLEDALGNDFFDNNLKSTPRDNNSQIKARIRQINEERWQQMGYIPSDSNMNLNPFF